jgi:sigma-E factor negative regulatory protein RseA
MSEDFNQKISQFLDNELDHNQALNLLNKIKLQPELQDKLNHYQSISNAIKTGDFILAKDDFLTKIQEQLHKEPIHFFPSQNSSKWSHKQIALAASIAIIAVIAGNGMLNLDLHSKIASNIQVAQYPQPQKASVPVAYANKSKQYPLNKRINDYLQAHNSSVYTNGEANFQPFTRVTAYSQK